ncbi:Protein of unknown function [Haloechinothrix alba]|uniref:DUF2470 domain-containing protein n=1 Tax=Haloechinothrix alba TaxID=664784 RepID=A0A238XW36_9PSEU|nr:DUF2470 domain-containing protein [Haloechinothrix alba]SNR63266.1 Protein of unknown function [Haloechinothrix alba]
MTRRPPTPEPAERAKSIVVRRGPVTLVAQSAGGPDPAPVAAELHHLHPDGTLSLVFGSDKADQVATEDGSRRGTSVVELVDVAPVGLREPARGLLWITGDVHRLDATEAHNRALRIAERTPHPSLLDVGHGAAVLCVRPVSVVLSDGEGTESVRLQEFGAALPDPFSRWESRWLAHLESGHPEVLCELTRHVPPCVPAGPLRPLGLDRFGLRLRVESPAGDHDIRMAFSRPARNLRDVEREVRRLVGCPCTSPRAATSGWPVSG